MSYLNLWYRLFLLTQRIGKSVENAMNAAGSFIAINNTISQSVPHLHIHIVPRNKHDGLKGFLASNSLRDRSTCIRNTTKIIHQIAMT